jgi:hypothetical protein
VEAMAILCCLDILTQLDCEWTHNRVNKLMIDLILLYFLSIQEILSFSHGVNTRHVFKPLNTFILQFSKDMA